MRVTRPDSSQPTQFTSVNPASGEVIRTYPGSSPEQIEASLSRSVDAFASYRLSSPAERARAMSRAAGILEGEKDRWARLMSEEMGKTYVSAIQEVEKCALTCRHFAEHGARMLAELTVVDDSKEHGSVQFQPLGTVLAIMPWNFPFWQVFRFAAPTLTAGNTAILKHASNVPGCALAIEEIWKRSGLAEGVFQTLLITGNQASVLVEDPRIRAVSLTGSDAAGAEVAARAGRGLKKCVLELGGSDPFIVMPSVDLDAAVRMAVNGRTINNGESCVASKRFIVHEAIADEFERRFVAAMKALRVGDPLDPETQLGPLAKAEIRDRLARQVEDSVREGARVLTGGRPVAAPGYYYEPTVLTSIAPGSRAYREEFFGPVALLFRAKDLDDAIRIANDNPFGLGSTLWSLDLREQQIFARDIESGSAFVNQLVTSHPLYPFGGVKRSGYGRELSEFGIREFVNIKTVRVLKALPEDPSPKKSFTE